MTRFNQKFLWEKDRTIFFAAAPPKKGQLFGEGEQKRFIMKEEG